MLASTFLGRLLVLFLIPGGLSGLFSGQIFMWRQSTKSTHILIIRDTTLRSSNRSVRTFSINGKFPPADILIRKNNQAIISLHNDTRSDLILILPTALLLVKPNEKWLILRPGQAFTSELQTQKSGVFDYRITHLEQLNNGVKGLIVIDNQ